LRVQATSIPRPVARRRTRATIVRAVVVTGLLVAVLAALVGLAFAGSSARLAEGVTIAGIDVGGLTRAEALKVLENRADRVARVPVVFTAGEDRFPIKASTLGVRADWSAALASAMQESQGFGPVRGYKRLHARFFGAEIAPPVQAYSAALEYKLGRLAGEIDRAHVEAKLVRHGLSIAVVPGQSGRHLEREAAADTIVRALARLDRGSVVALPLTVDPADVTASQVAPAARRARLALSAPVRLEYEGTRWKLPRWRIAELLSLPENGSTRLAIAGPGADAWFAKLRKNVERPPADATFAVTADGIEVVPAKDGLALDLAGTAKALLAAATSETARTAPLAVETSKPERSTAEASAMGITGIVGSYTTTYGGIPSRLHNVALVSELIDGTLIAPGQTFSFNETTGERTAEKGFQEAPVIINGELQNGLGGGICQVSTTLFNAAYEGGLEIDQRTNHALYIAHYPLGRDATVNYPDLDLKFTNDTDKWLLLRTFVGSGSLTVNLYGTPQDRRVETIAAPLEVVGQPETKRIREPTMEVGETRVESYGQPARSTSVRRVVYGPDDQVLHEDTWYSSYQSEPKLVHVGTKPKPKPKKPDPKTDPVPADPVIPSFDELPETPTTAIRP
jgi:vancomycin resistance protein YoaR